MRSEELTQLLRRKPFVPIRLHTTDGQSYDIRHPDLVMVFHSRATIGVAPDPVTGVLAHAEYLSLLHIVRVEELATAAPADNGTAS